MKPSASWVNADNRSVIEQHRALFIRGLGQVDQQPGVVELSVVVDDAAAQSLGAPGSGCARAPPSFERWRDLPKP